MKKETMFKIFSCDFFNPLDKQWIFESKNPEQSSSKSVPPGAEELPDANPQSIDPIQAAGAARQVKAEAFLRDTRTQIDELKKMRELSLTQPADFSAEQLLNEKSVEASLPEDLKYFRDLDPSEDPDERWLVYSVLKDFFGFTDVDKESSLEDLRKRWPQEHVGEHVGVFFDVKDDTWKDSSLLERVAGANVYGKYLIESGRHYEMATANQELRQFIKQRIGMFDAAERQPDKAALAKSHTKDGYVNYFLLKGFGFHVNPKWKEDRLKDMVDENKLRVRLANPYNGYCKPSEKIYYALLAAQFAASENVKVPIRNWAEKEWEEFNKS